MFCRTFDWRTSMGVSKNGDSNHGNFEHYFLVLRLFFSHALFGWVFKAILKSCLSPRRLLLSKLMCLMCSVWRLLHDWLSEEKAPSFKSQWSELPRDRYTCCITRHIHVTIVTHEESEIHLGEIISSNIKNPSYNLVVQKALGQGCKVKIPCSLQNKNLLSSALVYDWFKEASKITLQSWWVPRAKEYHKSRYVYKEADIHLIIKLRLSLGWKSWGLATKATSRAL